MSSSARYYQPRCVPCFKANIRNKLLGFVYGSWTCIEFLRSTGHGGILQCTNCGHKWRSYSKFAKRKAYDIAIPPNKSLNSDRVIATLNPAG